MPTNKYVIYTSLTGGYDALPQYEVIDSDFDYICFSNDYPDGSKQGIWTIKHIPIRHKNLTRLSRYVKLMPHTVLSDYQWSVWIDANIIILQSDVYEAFKNVINKESIWAGIKHPNFDCIYRDAKECLETGKCWYSQISPQIKFLQKQQYPIGYGLFENNIIIRKHNDETIRLIDDLWWKLYEKYSPRDQLSLFYIFWKNNFKPELIFNETINTHNSKHIRFVNHPNPSILFRFKRKTKVLINKVLLRFYNLF